MKITNRFGLPGAIVQALKAEHNNYNLSHISVAELIGPPQIRTLAHQNPDITQDASSMIWALMGKAMHQILEQAEPSAIVEQRLYLDIQGWKLGGQFDRMTLSRRTLQDYKFASVWELIHGLKSEREQQMNVLAELALHNGYPIKRLEIVHLCRDWSAVKAKGDIRYPQRQISRVEVPLWSADIRQQFIEQRVALHQAADHGDVAPCTDDDRWYSGASWAVMKPGRKSAIKLHDSEAQAHSHATELGGQHYVEHRPGEHKRCASYCLVASVCPQWAMVRPTGLTPRGE